MDSGFDQDFIIQREYLEIGEPIASGSFGTVYKGKWPEANEVAIKQLFIQNPTIDTNQELQIELTILKKLRHPNVIQLYGYCPQPLSLVMELMTQSLFQFLHNNNEIPWLLRYQISLDIVAGLQYIHQQEIIHRDLKSNNILLDSKNVAKITDLGLAKIKTESESFNTNTKVGTIRWMAPELLLAKPQYSKKSDIYALGMVFWEIASQFTPFEKADEKSILLFLMSGGREEMPVDCPEQYAQIINGCWAQEVQNRLEIEQIKKMLMECIKSQKQIDQQAQSNSQQSQKSIQNTLEESKQSSRQQAQMIIPQQQKEGTLTQNLTNLTFDNLVQFLNKIKEENVDLIMLKQGPLNQTRFVDQIQILLQLPYVTNQQIHQKLSQIIQQCKQQQGVSQVASNSLTLLNYMNYVFTNQNLQNLDLSNADISDTTFTSCNFSNSNLTSANLRNTKFINCDLSNANLSSIITEHPHIYTGHTGSVYAVAISSDTEFIVSGSDDKTVRLWNVKTGTCKTMSGHTGSVRSVAISSDSEFIVSGSDDYTVRLWDVKTGTYKTMSGPDRFLSVAISSNSEFIVSGNVDNKMRLWDIKTGTCMTMSGHTSFVKTVAISSDSEFIVSGSYDKTLRLWDVKTGTCKIMSGHTSFVLSVAISSDSELIVSGSTDRTLRLWNSRTQQCIKVISEISYYVYSVIFSVNSKFILSGSYDKTIRIWNLSTGQCICVLMGLNDQVGSLAISKDNIWLVSSNQNNFEFQSKSTDYVIRRWNIGRLLNGVETDGQQQVDWNKVYCDYGLRFQNSVMSNVTMSGEDKQRYINS